MRWKPRCERWPRSAWQSRARPVCAWTACLLVPVVLVVMAAGDREASAGQDAGDGEVQAPVSERFAAADTQAVPSFRRDVIPLMGRVGCNGRACHGSFQGQGGFRLSLFGYDFDADHAALLDGDPARVNVEHPLDSLILNKPIDEFEHGGGKRIDKDSWQWNVLRRWVESGAVNDSYSQGALKHLEVTPTEISFDTDGQQAPLRVVAHWSDGTSFDVTPVCRFQTNDESVVEVDDEGVVVSRGSGDTHVVVFYDNGIVPVPVLRSVDPSLVRDYPLVPTPTKIDELVVAKLRKLGIVPSELCSDAEFLRRVSLDITGALPAVGEIELFLADESPDKRSRKIDELLERPDYAALWATRLCDITGNNRQVLQGQFRDDDSRQWYDWLADRLERNVPYDKIVAGIALATSRAPGQSYEEYCSEAAAYYRTENPESFTRSDTMPHFWARNNARSAEDKALSFAYAFLGVRLQCAQCHKHPFDQWRKDDFEQFTAFFDGVRYGVRPEDRAAQSAMEESLGLADLKGGMKRSAITEAIREGKAAPLSEVYVVTRSGNSNAKDDRRKNRKRNGASRVITPKLLGGEEVVLSQYDDPREAVMEWMASEENPYFARAIVNRVWAGYFHVGIIDPPDDQNLANPPSNEPLLDWLCEEFIAHDYDLKWLHRTIAGSRTYQLSWRPNETNRDDARNFSRAVPRRLPAEVVYDIVRQATAGREEAATMSDGLGERAIGPEISSGVIPGRARYSLTAFGKPQRTANCDCERSDEASLLQVLYLRNDAEALALITRSGGWLDEVTSPPRPAPVRQGPASFGEEAQGSESTARESRQQQSQTPLQQMEAQMTRLSTEYAQAQRFGLRDRARAIALQRNVLAQRIAAMHEIGRSQVPTVLREVIREAYLRTVSREPTDEERERAFTYIAEAPDIKEGLRDVIWALVNTKEFIVNH